MELVYGILQLVDLFKYHDMHLYFLFFLWVWLIWLIKIIFARRYRDNYPNEYQTSVSIIVPTYNEIPEVFEKALISTIREKPDEVIIVLDGPNEELKKIAKSFDRVKVITIPKSGKRKAFAVGAENSKGEIIIMKDSDTLFTEGSLKELIKPFVDPKVGGTTPDIRIFNPNGTWIRRITEWIHDQRSNITAPAQSSVKTVSCMPGPCAAFLRKPLLDSLEEFMTESFLGIRCETGDDRSLTNLVLKKGYDTIFQKKSVVYTDSQETLWAFIKQQLRWARSSQRNSIMCLNWMFRKPLFFSFHLVTELIMPFFLTAVLIFAGLNLYLGFDKVTLIEGTIFTSLWFGAISSLVGINLSLGIRQITHFRRNKGDILWLPAYIFVVVLILFPIRIFAFFTMTNQGWMTRNNESNEILVKNEGVEAK
jgi:cellulose synthase/poly-beta-1,6-N-acetylglucosamine synthase-like glycosyltransferase